MKKSRLVSWFSLALTLVIFSRESEAAPAPLNADYFAVLRSGDAGKLRAALDRGASASSRDAQGNTPLMLAAVYGDTASMRLLLDRGAEVNATNAGGATALMRAACDYRKTELLVERGANVQARSASGNTALILAARPADSHRTVELLLARGADAKAATQFGATALMAAAAGGDEKSVELLLKHGANPNAQTTPDDPGFIFGGGRSALMWAAFRGHVSIMKRLLAAGADVNGVGGLGTPLAQAAWADRTAAGQLLLDRGARHDLTGPMDGYAPLHWAAGTESTDTALVKALLQHGANPNLGGGEHVDSFMGTLQTPLMLARRRGQTPVLALLKASGATAGKPDPAPTPMPARSLPERLDAATLRAAVARAVSPLQRSAIESKQSFLRHSSKQDCTSCHQQHLPLAATAAARKLGVPVDTAAERALIKIISPGELKGFEIDWQPLFHPDAVFTKGYTLLGFAAADMPAEEITDAAVHHLAAIQGADGQWFNNLPRPPIQTGDISATALAVQALQRYPLPGRRPEFARRVERARQWLRTARPQNTDSRIYQLLGLAWAGDSARKLQPLAKALIAEQRADGGWAQLPGLTSDAYATAQAVYALRVGAGLGNTDPAIDRGLRFLLQTQLGDGTWHVLRRAFPFQPTMSSGFPHGRDSWISSAASSWAVMAMSLPDAVQTAALER